MGRSDPEPAQQRADADHGELRHARRFAFRLCHASNTEACSSLFAAATPPGGGALTDTVNTPEAVALYPWYQPERLYALLDQFYPVPTGKNLRPVPFMPYLNYAPSAWVLPLKFDGGGYRAGGKCMFDSEGNLWVGDNFTIGW